MIIVKLAGGLGNQMFQYAAGYALAKRHNVELKVDTSYLDKEAGTSYTQRQLELHTFKLEVDKATEKDRAGIFNQNKNYLVSRFKSLFPFLSRSVHATERGHGFKWQFSFYPANTYLDGFWQSEKYFSSFATDLREQFVLKDPFSVKSGQLLALIRNTECVGIHVRRGDYVNLPSAASFHGTCSPQYYEAGLKYILSLQPNIKICFVFSDDIEWCRENLKSEIPFHFVEQGTAAEGLILLSHCNHQVIANSSFSWWAAWLNSNPDKIVVMPEKWFTNLRSSSIDIVPENWTVL